MSHRSRSLRRAAAAALAPIALVAGLVAAAAPAQADVSAVPQTPSTTEIYNSGRGMYSWLEQPSMIPGWATTDVYWRDQIQWGSQVERSRGQYDFSAFDAGLAQAGGKRGRFSFRVMALCPGCGGNLTPSYVPRQRNGAPDWNSEEFLSSYERLMGALGARYDRDPRLGVVDVGGYGMWGEWYCDDSCGTPITNANLERILRAASQAFPSKYLTMPFDLEVSQAAARINPKIGLRFDCIGGDFPMTLKYLPEEVKNVWKRAPVVAEWCPIPGSTATKAVTDVRELHVSALSSSNFATPYDQLSAAEQASFRQAYVTSGFRYSVASVDAPRALRAGSLLPVRLTVSNTGVAPTYDSWRARLHLVNSAGKSVVTATLPVDLRKLADGSLTTGTNLVVPTTLPAGSYRVAVAATDNAGYLKPLAFANPGRDSAGRYALGSVSVTANDLRVTKVKRVPKRR